MGIFNELSVNSRMSDDEIRDVYLSWLCQLINVDRTYDHYTVLPRRLHSINFTWFIPNDDNRGYDGQKLRDMFIEDLGLGSYEESALKGPCSVLEMIIGLAIHIGDLMADWEDGTRAGMWFWVMMSNLGLDMFTDYDYDRMGGHVVVDDIIGTLLNRGYDRDGKGGLFPVKSRRVDQRKVELWYQMNTYLNEKYNVDC